MSKLLFDEQPLVIDKNLAVLRGIITILTFMIKKSLLRDAIYLNQF